MGEEEKTMRRKKQIKTRKKNSDEKEVWRTLSPSAECLQIITVLCFRDHAEKSMSILSKILPEDHLLLSSSKRVKGNSIGLCP